MNPNVVTTSRFIGSDAMLIAIEGDLDLATIERAESPAQDNVLSVVGIDERFPQLPTLESAAGWLQLQERELSPNASPLT